MGVFKEEASILESVCLRQTQIFSDSHDYGYPYNSKKIPSDISNLIKVINLFKEMDKKYPDERPIVRNRKVWGDNDGVSLDVILFWESNNGYYRGTKYSISFNKINPNHPNNLKRGSDSYIFIYPENYKELI